MTSTFLDELVLEGYLGEIDQIFAQWLSRKMGREEEAEQLFLAILFWSSRQGHLCFSLNEEIFSHFGERRVRVVEYLKRGAQAFPFFPFICQEAGYFYLQKNWMFETQFLFHLRRLIAQGSKVINRNRTYSTKTDEQDQAVANALAFPLSLISGGPGTGKTHTAAKIVEAFLKQNPESRILLAAPTGKAAQRLSSNSWGKKVVAGTLHALLGIHRESSFVAEPSPIMADLLIVDECSMVDARVFSLLLAAVKKGTHLVLIGDAHQLPAVENGSLFADLVDLLKTRSPEHLTMLTRCLRSDRQEILQFMQSVLGGDLTHHNSELLQIADYNAVERRYAEIQKICEAHFPLPDALERDLQPNFALLSCLRKGPFGVDALNRMLSDHFLKKRRGEERLAMPILITKNCEDLGLFNGETGLLIRHRSSSLDYAVFGSNPLRKIPAAQLPTYEYAYALSVHKSQGSEYEEVLLLVPPGSEQLGREVIYTGASRAKKVLRVAADQNALNGALQRPSRKISALHARLMV